MEKKHRYPDNSTVKTGLGPAGAEFFPGCLPLVSGHICLEFLRELPGAFSTQTILIWLNTWFILSLRWGKSFVLIGLVNLQNPFRAIYWQACLNLGSPCSASAACCNGREPQFSIYSPNEKKHLKAAIHWARMQFPRPELTSYSPNYTCCERLIRKINTISTTFINLWLRLWRSCLYRPPAIRIGHCHNKSPQSILLWDGGRGYRG